MPGNPPVPLQEMFHVSSIHLLFPSDAIFKRWKALKKRFESLLGNSKHSTSCFVFVAGYRDELLAKIIQLCSQSNYQYITNFEW